ncbi:uncharacterized protein PV09_09273 [Verruconis gallopava]|uniref:Uncharacterized protein n=1 Tax=Verruconis gallopava TaxID=253628 RepID=A0A0D2AJB3_9PEZI|nr:uncharacterized protein PV09_09273 [Verruconis gallopava]KIV98993.1 hypothetical protein PV09_09273 [Verruconis gallopava]
MVILVDDDQISSLWAPGRDGGALEAAFSQDFEDDHEQEGLWRHSLDPKREEHMPQEYRSWERWSDHFDKEPEARILAFNMNSDCTNCGHSAWDLVERPGLKAIQCRSCGHTPTECGSSRFASSRFSTYTNCSRPSVMFGYQESEGSEAEGETFEPVPLLEDDEESVTDETEGIIERDFGTPGVDSPRTATAPSAVRSVRQSVAQPVPRPRWFEAEENVTFRFKLTPRGRDSAGTSVPRANEDGSSRPAVGHSGESSSHPPGKSVEGHGPARGVHVRELADDPTAWQRLLTSALFLIKEDHMPMRPGEAKVLDLGLLNARQSGGKHLAMRHHSVKEYEDNVQAGGYAAKRIRWRVVVKQVQEQERGSLLPK